MDTETFHSDQASIKTGYTKDVRFNRRWREGELFRFGLRRATHGDPLPYRRLTAEALG